jgi:hypothetical protein
MQFIKQNLFLVIVGAVLLVGASILMAMQYQKADQEHQLMQERQMLDEDIRRTPTNSIIKLSEKPGELPLQIRELKTRLGDLKDEDEKVKSGCVDWNVRTYKVLQMRFKTRDKETLVDAFPNVDQFKNAGNLCLLFKNTYRGQLESLQASMSPVAPVTQEEMDEEVNRHLIRLQQDAALEAARKKKLSSKPAADTGDEKDHKAAHAHGDAGLTEDFTAQAREKAVRTLMLRQATQKGRVYITPGALESVFVNWVEPSATATELWQAQINLWVQGDIIEAINAANDYSTGLVRAKVPNVLTSAVKRLVKINVGRDYCQAPGSGSAAPAPAGGGTSSGGGTSGFHLSSAEPSAGPAAGPAEENLELTQHFSNKDYDVIHYQFTVVMPARFIPALESCLMQRNFHTILKVETAPLSVTPETVTAGNAAIPPYYGPDAVIEVTFQGELLLLTSWERGKYNSTENKWDSPALMPKEVLAALPPSILRPEDAKRLAPPPK